MRKRFGEPSIPNIGAEKPNNSPSMKYSPMTWAQYSTVAFFFYVLHDGVSGPGSHEYCIFGELTRQREVASLTCLIVTAFKNLILVLGGLNSDGYPGCLTAQHGGGGR
jgi:hypothetical protein